MADASDEKEPTSGVDTSPGGGHVDVLKALRDAVLSGETSDTTAAQQKLLGRYEQEELDEVRSNTGLQRVAIVVHSLRRIVDDEGPLLNALPGPLRTVMEELKLAVDSTDDALVATGL